MVGRILRQAWLNFAKIQTLKTGRKCYLVMYQGRSDGHVYVRRIVGEKFNDRCVMNNVRIMVWGCIHSTEVVFLTNVEERLNIDLLGNYMIHLLSIPGTWIFQYDNVPCKTIYSCNA